MALITLEVNTQASIYNRISVNKDLPTIATETPVYGRNILFKHVLLPVVK